MRILCFKVEVQIGFAKIKCMIIFGESLSSEPIWHLNSHRLGNVNSLEILRMFLKIVHLSPGLALWTRKHTNVEGHSMACAI